MPKNPGPAATLPHRVSQRRLRSVLGPLLRSGESFPVLAPGKPARVMVVEGVPA